VVDDAIMVLENIVRYRESGLSRVRAAIVGAREITFAAMAASIAILAIFVPVVFMKGIMGKFFYQFGVTMSVGRFAIALGSVDFGAHALFPVFRSGHTTWIGKNMDLFQCTSYPKDNPQAFWEPLSTTVGGKRSCWRTLFFAGSLYIYEKPQERVRSRRQDQSLFLVRLQTPVGFFARKTPIKFLSRRKVLS